MNYPIHSFNNLLSTNSFLKSNIKDFSPYSTIWADGQESGKGRFNRAWSSVKGKDLTFSILIPLNKTKSDLWQNLTQVTALAILDNLRELGFKTKIKWPNDVLVENQKICGILCEVVEFKGKSYSILGVGLNVNSSREELEHIDQPAGSLFSISQKIFIREELLYNIVSSIISNVKSLEKNGFSDFKDELEKTLAWKNELKIIHDGTSSYSGKIQGLNSDGTLKFMKEDGEIMNFNSGEIGFVK